MTSSRRSVLVRLGGLAGVLASAAYTLGDVLLLGKPVRREEHPELVELGADVSALAMVPASTGRLTAGAMAGVYGSPLYLAGAWHLYQGLRPAGRSMALPPVLILAGSWTWASFVHGSFFHSGEAWKAVERHVDDPELRDELRAQAKAYERSTVLAYAPLAAGFVAGSVLIMRAVHSGETAYPRWAGPVVAPLLPIVGATALTASHVLPGPAKHLLQGAGISLGEAISFAASTALLWRSRRAGD